MRNTALSDMTGTQFVGTSNLNQNNYTINTIPPRISYVITLPGQNKTYVRMSQPVALYSSPRSLDPTPGTSITGSRVQSYDPEEKTPARTSFHELEIHLPLGGIRYDLHDDWKPPAEGELSYIVTLNASPDINDLQSLPEIGLDPGFWYLVLGELRDMGVRALDWFYNKITNNQGIHNQDTYSYFSPPRYPVDWKYSGYDYFPGNAHVGLSADSPPFNPVFYPPNRVLTPEMVRNLSSGGNVIPDDFNNLAGTVVERRITDVLVSLPPTRNDSDNYFAWPVWARYRDTSQFPGINNNPGDNFWGQMPTDTGIIWKFDGTDFLEASDEIEIQARLGNNMPQANLQLFWTTDISEKFRNPAIAPERRRNTGGLWLPGFNLLYNLAPVYTGNQILPAVFLSANGQLQNFSFNNADRIVSGSKLEFLFRRPGSDMFIARLDVPQGTTPANLPDNWYQLVRPFGFDIQDIRLQRGGVTILNNVINSDLRENTFVRYNLARPGRVTIQVYTLDGTLVRSLKRNEQHAAGWHTAPWDGTNQGGRAVARGMYFIRVVGPDIDEIRKVMVIRN